MSTTLETLQTIIANKYELDKSLITPTAALSQLKLDSIDVLEIIFVIEESFGITVPDKLLANLATVNDMTRLIDSLLATNGKPA